MNTRASRPRSSLAFFTFATVAVLSTAVSVVRAGVGEEAHTRFDREKTRAAGVLGRAAPTSTSPAPSSSRPLFDELRLGRGDVASARAMLARRERSDAGRLVAVALGRVDRIERHPTPIGSFMAASLAREVAALLESDPALLAEPEVARALDTTRLASAARPFERDRRFVLANLSEVPGQGRIPDTSLTRAAAGRVMLEADRTLTEMQAATLAGDEARCRRAAAEASVFVRAAGPAPGTCVNAARVVDASRRLAHLRAEAKRTR